MTTTMMTSISCSPYGISEAMRLAERKLKSSGVWKAADSDQARFLHFPYLCGGAETITEIKAVGSDEAPKIKTWMSAQNFGTKAPTLGNKEIGLASSFDMWIKWAAAAGVATVMVGKKNYSFVSFRSEQFEFYSPPAEFSKSISTLSSAPNNFIVAVQTANKGERVFFLMVQDAPSSAFDLIEKVEYIQSMKASKPEIASKTKFQIPMIDFEEESTLDWMNGLSTQDDRKDAWVVASAIQKNRIRFSEFGDHLKTGGYWAPRTLQSTEIPMEMIFDKPFLMWVEREGLKEALFSAYVTPAHWKAPSKKSN